MGMAGAGMMAPPPRGPRPALPGPGAFQRGGNPPPPPPLPAWHATGHPAAGRLQAGDNPTLAPILTVRRGTVPQRDGARRPVVGAAPLLHGARRALPRRRLPGGVAPLPGAGAPVPPGPQL